MAIRLDQFLRRSYQIVKVIALNGWLIRESESTLLTMVDNKEAVLDPQNLAHLLGGRSGSSGSKLTGTQIREAQQLLFGRLGVSDHSSLVALEDQMPWIDAQIKADFERGQGSEISSGKILNPISSAALAVNFFAPWRSHLGKLGASVGAPWVDQMSFEVEFPTGLSGTSPTLDVLFSGGVGPAVAVEAKFTEPYYWRRPSNTFSPSYFAEEKRDELWKGLRSLRKLAFDLDSGEVEYQFLNGAQLIKHALGLARKYGTDGFWLTYVWFDGKDEVSRAHRREIEHFTLTATKDIHFGAIDYRELSLILGPSPEEGHAEYLDQRYLSSVPAAEDPERNAFLPLAAAGTMANQTSPSESFPKLSPTMVISEYSSLGAQAPSRHSRDKLYFVPGHDLLVADESDKPLETHLQRAMTGKMLKVGGLPSVRLLDYEVPLKTFQADPKLGEADLFGVEEDGRHVVLELKVLRYDGTYDSPLRALLEGLTHSAVLTANHAAISEELKRDDRGFGLTVDWEEAPEGLRLIIAAPSDYWQAVEGADSEWLNVANSVVQSIVEGVGIEVQLVDLGSARVHHYETPSDSDGRVRPLLSVNGVLEGQQIDGSVLASWSSEGQQPS